MKDEPFFREGYPSGIFRMLASAGQGGHSVWGVSSVKVGGVRRLQVSAIVDTCFTWDARQEDVTMFRRKTLTAPLFAALGLIVLVAANPAVAAFGDPSHAAMLDGFDMKGSDFTQEQFRRVMNMVSAHQQIVAPIDEQIRAIGKRSRRSSRAALPSMSTTWHRSSSRLRRCRVSAISWIFSCSSISVLS